MKLSQHLKKIIALLVSLWIVLWIIISNGVQGATSGIKKQVV